MIGREYKETKIGLIPEDWILGQFDDLAIIEMGQSPDGNSYNNIGDGIPLINGPTEFSDRFPVKLQWTSAPTKVCLHGDILFCVRGSSTGRINISDDNYCIGRGIAAIRNKNNGDIAYIEHLLINVTEKILKLTSGSTFPNIDKKNLSSILIPLPPLPEQKKIAEILSTWDRAIEKTEKLIVAKNKLKKGLMQQLLTGRKRFKEFEKDKWSYVFIKDILKEVNRPIEWDEAKLYPLISVRRRSGGLFYRESLYGYQIKTKNLKTARAGDFLISKMQVVHGAMGLTSEEFDSMYISDSYISLIPCDEKKLNIDFFNYLSQMRHMYYIALVSSTGVHIEKMTFDLNDFLHHKVFIPENIKEQQRIASVLSAIDNEISVLNKKLNAIKQQKKGLMQKLLTGQVRVKV